MDLRLGELLLQHRHRDGTWGRLEPRPPHHSPAEHDPERHWPEGRLYACTTCEEQVVVSETDDRVPEDRH